MGIFKKKAIFNEDQNKRIVKAIEDAEKMTSGEVRVYIELKCKYVDALDRAHEIFQQLNMENTKERNGVLVYVAMKDRQFAILGDKGIHEKVGDSFWKEQRNDMLQHFQKGKFIDGISSAVRSIGASLKSYFPHQSDDENELPDDVIYG